jgi:phospholipid/cholesterol/gamma-HCH transport system substrate-binding protein
MNQIKPSQEPGASGPSDEELRTAVPRGQHRREFRVGIFVLLGLVSVLGALFLLTDPSTFRGRYQISTLVEDAGGIRRGDAVQMRGVNIGRVLNFTMAPGGVLITLELEGRWEIPSGSKTRLVSAGIVGGRTVEILEGDGPGRIPPGGQMLGENVEGILDFPPELGRDAQAVLVRIQDLLAEPTTDAIRASAQEFQTLLSHLSEIAQAQGEEIARLTASLNRSAEGLEDAAGSGDDLARAVARADSALLTVNRTSESILRASSSLEAILRRVEAGEGTLGQLSTNSALYDTLMETVESIRLLAEDVKENPGRYFKVEIF